MSNRIREEFLQAKESVRLNKYLSEAGVCSRREADRLIESGKVTVDGVTAQMGMRVTAGQIVKVGKKTVSKQDEMIVLAVNKPKGIVCTEDQRERDSIVRFLNYPVRVTYAGRLDKDSEGLLLLTNDGQLAQRLTHPRHHQPKVYEVLVRGAVPGAALAAMRRGMVLAEGEKLMPVEVDARPAANGTLMRMVLHQGINRQIRRMCRDFGLTILRLKRVAQGPLELGRLALGAARHLSTAEVAALKKSVAI